MAKFYLHSAIPYVNALPHVGHAQEFVYADVVRRYHILVGKNVRYLCGADENAIKIVQAAEKAGVPTQKFCDKNSDAFLALVAKLNVGIDVWQRSSDKEHHYRSSQKLWGLCLKSGDIYKKSYEGLYCIGCESFYTPDELNKNGECIEHPGQKLEKVSEENYFFRLSKYQAFIENLITSDKLKVIPQFRENEVLSFIRRGLEDFSISRSIARAKGWGVPVPGDQSQIMYVWFDALNIYYSGIGLGWNEKQFSLWAPADLMVIGKGILRFHAVYWPAILKSANLPLPKELFVHGYLTVDGQKMSKTLGNVVNPLAIINKYGTDALRYYLLREIPSYKDGDFSERRFKELYNADLANGLGNLVARVAKLTQGVEYQVSSIEFREVNTGKYRKALEEYLFHDALAFVWEKIKKTDKFIDEKQPWTLKDEALADVLNTATQQIIEIATILQPFLPETAQKILKQFSALIPTPQTLLFPRIL